MRTIACTGPTRVSGAHSHEVVSCEFDSGDIKAEAGGDSEAPDEEDSSEADDDQAGLSEFM